MKRVLSKISVGSWLLVVVSLLALSAGCATSDPNLSERPWNTQQNWEHGLPTGFNQGR